MRKLFLIIMTLVLLFSCKKSNNASQVLQYPATMVSVRFEGFTYPRVYTKNGEITNKTLIDQYVKGRYSEYFYFNTDTIIYSGKDTITFNTVDTVVLSFGLAPKRVVKQTQEYIYFYMPDTLIGNKNQDVGLDNIRNNIGIFKPYYKDNCPSYMGSTCFTQWIYDAYIARGSTDMLELPLLTYKITRSANGSNSGLASKNYNNIFDKTVLNLLHEGDTIAVQSAKYIFERRR